MARVNRYKNWLYPNWPDPWHSAWVAAVAKGNLFRAGGPAERLAPRSVLNNEMAFGRYHEFLTRNGQELIGPTPCLDQLRAFALHLGETVAPYSVLANLSQLIAAIRLMYPKADLQDANTAAQRLASLVRPVRPVETRLLTPIQSKAIGEAMMAEADQQRVRKKATARLFRTGALILASAMCPLRHRNWRMMRIAEHIDLDTGQVSLKAAEMKRKRPMEFRVPPEVLQALQRFAEHYRPLLLKPGALDESYLWPGPGGGATHRNAMGIAVKAAILKRAGKAFNFHLFRHSAATFISEASPDLTRIASGVLHHSRVSTTDKHYIKGQKRRAFRHYQKGVRGILVNARRRQKRQQPKKQGRGNT
jgi:integrase